MSKFLFKQCVTPLEWESYHDIKEKEIFSNTDIIYDRKHLTFSHPNHFHFILYHEENIVSIAHVEFLDAQETALRSLATNSNHQNKGFASKILLLLEDWIKKQNGKIVKMHAALNAESFYRKRGYTDMVFDSHSIFKEYINLGKFL